MANRELLSGKREEALKQELIDKRRGQSVVLSGDRGVFEEVVKIARETNDLPGGKKVVKYEVGEASGWKDMYTQLAKQLCLGSDHYAFGDLESTDMQKIVCVVWLPAEFGLQEGTRDVLASLRSSAGEGMQVVLVTPSLRNIGDIAQVNHMQAI